ncbi:MAG: hypothetical protein KDB14_08735 [Planctomycetales bacterium]|nr:hypothetical protein [Planctomycetales bacterium]
MTPTPHRIRLRQWQASVTSAGHAELSRHFNRPTGLDACQLLLRLDSALTPLEVQLNGKPLPAAPTEATGPNDGPTCWRWTISPEALLPRNSLQLHLQLPEGSEAVAQQLAACELCLEIYEPDPS